MRVEINYTISFIFQMVNIGSSVYSILNFKHLNHNYFVIFLILGLVVQVIATMISSIIYLKKIQINDDEQQYICSYYRIAFFQNVFPLANIDVFCRNDQNLYQIAYFLDRIQYLLRLILINFMVIFFNVIIYYEENTDENYRAMVPLILSILSSAHTLVNMQIFTYNQKVMRLFHTSTFDQGLINTILLSEKSEFSFCAQFFLFVLFSLDYYGFSVMFGAFSKILENFPVYYVPILMGIGLLTNIIFVIYICNRRSRTDDIEEKRIVTFEHVDENFSLCCLAFGPLSISVVYFIFKAMCVIGFFAGILYFFIVKDHLFEKIFHENYHKWVFVSAMCSIGLLVIIYPLYLRYFHKKDKKEILQYETEQNNDDLNNYLFSQNNNQQNYYQ